MGNTSGLVLVGSVVLGFEIQASGGSAEALATAPTTAATHRDVMAVIASLNQIKDLNPAFFQELFIKFDEDCSGTLTRVEF